MRKFSDYVWPVVGVAAALFSGWLLYREVRSISLDEVIDSLAAIPPQHWALAVASTLFAYAALAWYDRIALQHLGRRVSWPFVALTSFTTYALAHNIGASVLSGAVVRYRAYRTQGLTRPEIGVLVGLCTFTFVLAVVLLTGLLLVARPDLPLRYFDLPIWVGPALGSVLLAAIAAYVLGSWLHFKPLTIAGVDIYYPRLEIVWRQLIAGPLEILGAAGIIYFALPSAGNPGFLIVLGIFLASFSLALLSHSPGGLGVLEFVFVTGMPDADPADVLAALIVFRLFYLLVPLAFSLLVVLLFEREQIAQRFGR